MFGGLVCDRFAHSRLLLFSVFVCIYIYMSINLSVFVFVVFNGNRCWVHWVFICACSVMSFPPLLCGQSDLLSLPLSYFFMAVSRADIYRCKSSRFIRNSGFFICQIYFSSG